MLGGGIGSALMPDGNALGADAAKPHSLVYGVAAKISWSVCPLEVFSAKVNSFRARLGAYP